MYANIFIHLRIRLLTPDQVRPAGVQKRTYKQPTSDDPEHELNDCTYIPNQDLSHLLSDEDDVEDAAEDDGNSFSHDKKVLYSQTF
jgi:hypothetical protein